MAFGKPKDATFGQMSNPGPQPSGDTFRQQSSSLSKHAARPPKKPTPYFVDMFEPSLTQIDTIRLVPGTYIQEHLEGEGDDIHVVQRMSQFIKFVEHFDGHMRAGAICSAGVWRNFRDRRAPCHGCDIYFETLTRNSEGRYESTRMSRQDKFAFSVFSYAKYHEVEQIDVTTGQPRMNPRSNQPYLELVKCTGAVCAGCRGNRKTQVGRMTHWPMPYTQLQILRNASSQIGTSCSRCGTPDCIESLSWMCRACGDHIIRMDTTQLTAEEILKITDNPHACQCGHAGVLEELFSCRECTKRGQFGVRATIFDVDLKVQRVASGTDGKTKTLQVCGWSSPGAPAPQFAVQMKPVDLLFRYGPDTLARQAEKFHAGTVAPPPDEQGATAPAPNRQPVTDVAVPYQNPYAQRSS